MSMASLKQGKQLLELFSGAATEEVQNFVEAGDLLKMMFRADLARVDRQAFAALLTPPTDASRFDRYAPYLLALEDQLNLYEVLDASVWGGQVKKAGWFDDVDTASGHVQSVDDLEIFYIEFGSPQRNIEMYWKVIKANQPNVNFPDYLTTDPEHLRRGACTREYEPGIHRVRINLAAHWESERGRSVIQVRERAASSGEILAHAEVLAAYGLHDELFRLQDGHNLPYADMAGFEATVPGDQPWTSFPYLDRGGIDRGVSLNVDWVAYVNHSWAAPVVKES